jgi:phage shock protein A
VANFFKRAAKYANASANAKLEARADPRIQIEQAVESAQKQHQALTRQAASVIGNVKSIEMKLARQLQEQGKARTSAAQALQLADRARAEGDATKAATMERTATSFAGQVVTLDASIEDLKHLHEQAQQQAAQAKSAVDTSADQLKGFLAQRNQLLTQLESAKMQEQVAKSLEQVSSLSAPGDTPTLEQVREKIENRYAQAIGTSELASSSLEAQQLEISQASMDGAAALKLEEIRASLGAGSSSGAAAISGSSQDAITAGPSAAAADPLAATDAEQV